MVGADRSRILAWIACRPGETSGQLLANRRALACMAEAGAEVVLVELPAWVGRDPSSVATFSLSLVAGWLRILREVGGASALFVGAGQSPASFVRELVPMLAVKLLKPTLPLAMTLHGSAFTTWRAESLLARCYAGALRRADVVTCLGPNQAARLRAWGLPATVVRVVNNAPEVIPSSSQEVRDKWASTRPLQLLFLSNLIEEKGFRVYLEATDLVTRSRPEAFEVVLCGRFLGNADYRAEIDSWVGVLRSRGVAVQWVEGASGKDKDALFRRAHVFVFPSRYRVEAQPLVLIEAMAAGCAILTTDVGEIPAMFGDGEAVILPRDSSAEAIAAELLDLAQNSARAEEFGRRAHVRYEEDFSTERFRREWVRITRELLEGAHRAA